MEKQELMTGYEVVVRAAVDVGAEMFYGYPITPATDILTSWIKSGKSYLQTEDEIAAGFGVCGSVLAGQPAFTATAGPGHVLLQDAVIMAEAMRLPFVAVIGQRGGPSSGTVIYSQQEVTLACFGGNGEGHRLVYSPSSLEELYTLTARAFVDSWQHRFPAIVLTDGYLLKTTGLFSSPQSRRVDAAPLIKVGEAAHWQNIYSLEEELNEEILAREKDFQALSGVVSHEEYETHDAEILLLAHGIVGGSAKAAVQTLRARGIRVGLFRPVTLRPFPLKELSELLQKVKTTIIAESSLGQFAALVSRELPNGISGKVIKFERPALGIEPEEIEKFVENILK